MNHDQYVSKLELFTDDDAAEVLRHVTVCAACRRDARRVERLLASGRPPRGFWSLRFEDLSAVAAVAATVAIVLLHLPAGPGTARPSQPRPTTRYRIVGDASGVVAYTPAGTLTAVSFSRGKERSR